MGRFRGMAARIAAARAEAVAARRTRSWATALRRTLPLTLGLFCLWLLRRKFAEIDPAAVGVALWRVGPAQWLLALAATGASFAAAGQYDAVLHRLLGTRTTAGRAARAGMAAIAVSQTVGFGLVTGAFVRWRLLPGLGFAGAARLTAAVTASFLAGWAVVTALAVIVCLAPATPFAGLARPVALAVLALPALARILVLAAADTLAAALALHAFLPPAAAPAFAAYLPAFLIALGAGLMLGTPGGVGPFEVTLAALMPGVEAQALAAAILCYRAVYFALPAAVGGAAFLIGPTHRDGAVSGPALLAPGKAAPAAGAALAGAARAESLVYRQGCHGLLWDAGRRDGWVAGRAGPVIAALFDPLSGPRGLPRLLPGFAAVARAAGLVPALYKIGPRAAALARRAGWVSHPVAEDLWLAPALWSPDGPARATLRRKLRHADRARVTVTAHATGDGRVPWAALGAIAGRWRTRRGGERGFSMGRFAAPYLAGQRLYVARADARPVGFVSFQDGAREWALDLVRVEDDAPDGTAAALIVRALADARAAGVSRLSLAAVPLSSLGLSGPAARLARHLTRGEDGLARFKALFAPNRTRVYLAAPSRPALALAALSLALRIRWPGPLPRASRAAGTGRDPAHDHHDKLAFDNP